MLQKIIQFSVNNKLAVGIFVLIWILYGSYQVTRLPIDAVPDITNNQVQVITAAPALGAEDVERLITFPIEQALSNIPDIEEIRSMSRFGLSLITIVFQDRSDIYWARQQVTERLSQVSINENARMPELAPATTGLGEIYQYVLKPKPGFEQRYSLSDLRTIQDWMVRRQLLGTPGVADVSTFGGALKQYEVAISPAKLAAVHLSVNDVMEALRRNNQNTGGAYIEKGPTVLYIRSKGLATSVEDIGNIVLKTSNGTPVLVRHVADIRPGSAIRYGALTMAGFGELSGGIVMMLKDANSSEVIHNVKERVAAIQKTLPEGLEIEPFLDRTKMVNNAISTVKTNLLEGALIVILVLVLFLGNLRAGLIVASVIPLSMLFAISMMNLFGVSGNLMSLGALDFGLIVDGAVIIVEAVLHQVHHRQNHRGLSLIPKEDMNQEVATASSRMMNAAVFGQIIILIVYLPILSLSGIEGKMFKPMAQTVAFAVMGAFILSITYVPMISALVISRKTNLKPNISDRIMRRIEQIYSNILNKALRFKRALVLAAFAMFALALLLFSRLGGEFIPQLEEGDFATETRLLVGTNLSTTIDAFKRISERLQNDYPEVEKIVSRIGSAEIPTDPMPIEGGDMIIVLKDKKNWTSARSFSELAEKMSATAQQVVPGVTTGFQYPVQMRFNELMTGAKQDVVCKIFGEDLDKLAQYAEGLGNIARSVDGTADWYIEKVTGMPQIVIDFNRAEIAKFGLNIEDVNQTINAAFAGAEAGKIYEGEKHFDLVVRLAGDHRRDLNDVQNLLIATPSGIQVPLYQLADIQEKEGPNQIQRENTRRRILVGFNVRGRDVQSIVEELQQKAAKQLQLDPGYSITYGGAFENLQHAKSRLSIAVPAALLLIFGLLYFAFSSLRDGLLIYTAIPLSAIGGVFALAIRDMPFSISAGVGFIALFGVAVLNGIVLLSEFNRLRKQDHISDPIEIVMLGTRNRLRPVLITACVASLGFLPMAMSNGAGAEVQRPLATVVIGGLFSATLLTLFVLPALYLLIGQKKKKKSLKFGIAALLCCISGTVFAQDAPLPISIDDAIERALQYNLQSKAAQLSMQSARQLQSSAFELPGTNIDINYGQVSSIHKDAVVGISQSLSFPTVYINQHKVLVANYHAAEAQHQWTRQEIRAAVRRAAYQYAVLEERRKLLSQTDSFYQQFEARAVLRFEQGESNLLEKTAAETRRQHIAQQLQLLQQDMDIALRTFNFLLQDDKLRVPSLESPQMQPWGLLYDSLTNSDNPQVQMAHFREQAALYDWRTEKAKLLPELKLGYYNQSLIGPQQINGREQYFGADKRFHYFSAGIGIPLMFKPVQARIAAAKIDWERAKAESAYTVQSTELARSHAAATLHKLQSSVAYYQSKALKNAEAIWRIADDQFRAGAIDYLQWVVHLDQALSIKTEYLHTLADYNTALIEFLLLTNQ